MLRQFGKIAVTAFVASVFMSFGSAQAADQIPITTASEEARQAYLQGRDLLERLQGQESIQFFETAIAKDPNFALAYLSGSFNQPTGSAFFTMLKKAVELVDRVSDGERYMILGFQAGVNGNPAKQREYYEKLVKAYPGDERAHTLLATHYFGQQKYERAVEEFEKATKIAPKFSPPYNMLGYTQRALKNYAGAEKAFKKYIELIPNDPNPYDSYAELLLKMGQFDRSIQNYEKALEQNPNFVASYLGIATNLYLSGEYEKARAKLQQLFRVARNDGERRTALLGDVVTYVDEGDIDAALEDLDVSYRMGEKNNDVPSMTADLGTMAELLYESERYDEALAKWQKALELTKKSDLSQEIKENTKRAQLYNTGRVALKKGDLDKARAKADAFHEQAKTAGNTLQIWLSHDLLGMIALQENKHDKAVSHLLQASQQNPYVLYRLGLAYRGQGQSEKAYELFREAASFNIPTSLNFALARSKAEGMLATARR